MDHWHRGYGGRGGYVGGRGDDGRAYEGRSGPERDDGRGMMAEIDESLERLERTRSQGKITPHEFSEVRDVLELQRRQVGTDE